LVLQVGLQDHLYLESPEVLEVPWAPQDPLGLVVLVVQLVLFLLVILVDLEVLQILEVPEDPEGLVVHLFLDNLEDLVVPVDPVVLLPDPEDQYILFHLEDQVGLEVLHIHDNHVHPVDQVDHMVLYNQYHL
jgi:hypothetical protein